MKRIYVAHPFQGKPENLEAIGDICRQVVAFGHMPISPVHSLSFMCDEVPEEREVALSLCRKLVSFCDEVWLCGDWRNSEGCLQELEVAKQHGVRVLEYC